ncbi:MAG TPA: hypothetical protein VNX21_08610 [Candidatus Thermoplasmatota archaeon]|nr:hypothetical protein [Candidatus Thermoplasmatota archaeon]
MPPMMTDLRWGLLLPTGRACPHCGGAHHAGSCWSDPLGRHLEGALAR